MIGGDKYAGRAIVFRRAGLTTWDRGYEITAPHGNTGNQFGASVDIHGDMALVGEILHDGTARDTGMAWLFRRTGYNEWDDGTSCAAMDDTADGYLGRAVALAPETAVVGISHSDADGVDAGAACVFPVR